MFKNLKIIFMGIWAICMEHANIDACHIIKALAF